MLLDDCPTCMFCSQANNIIGYLNTGIFLGHAVFIVWSYIYLLKKCLVSKDKMGKFMQTCMPHLISLISFSAAFMLDVFYMRFGSGVFSQSLMNFMSMEILLVPPLLNPLIYGFKLTKIRRRILSFFSCQQNK